MALSVGANGYFNCCIHFINSVGGSSVKNFDIFLLVFTLGVIQIIVFLDC